MTFNEFRVYEGYKSREELVNDMACAGYTEDEIEVEWNKVEEGYSEYCEDENLEEVWED